MQTRTIVYVGVGLIVLGVLSLISNLTGLNFWMFCFPVGLIALGLLVILRPRMTRDGAPVHFELLGDIRRGGAWQVETEELWSVIGETKLDFSQAVLPEGETTLRVYNLIGDVSLTVPPGLGLVLNADTVLSTINWFGAKRDHFLSGSELSTPAYAQAERRLRVKVMSVVGDIKVKPA